MIGRWHGGLSGDERRKRHAQELRECHARLVQLDEEIAERLTLRKAHRKHLRALLRVDVTDTTERTDAA